MPKYKIKWKVGNYGESVEEIEATSLEEAEAIAWDAAHEEADQLCSASAELIEDDTPNEV